MKTKPFDYGKWGLLIVRTVGNCTRINVKRTFDFWDGIEVTLQAKTDQVRRRPDQWRRIYAEAKRRERGKEKVVEEKPVEIVRIDKSKAKCPLSGNIEVITQTSDGKKWKSYYGDTLWLYIDKLQQNQCGLKPGKRCPNVVDRLKTAIKSEKTGREE